MIVGNSRPTTLGTEAYEASVIDLILGCQQQNGDLDAFLLTALQLLPETAADAQEISEEITGALRTVAELAEELRRFKTTGGTRRQWLRAVLPAEVYGGAAQALAYTNCSLCEEMLDEPFPLEEMPDADESLRRAVDLSNLLVAISLKATPGIGQNDLWLVREAMESDLFSDREHGLKRLLTTGIVLAQKRGLISLSGCAAGQIALMVDRSISSVKLISKVASGETTWLDAMEAGVDRAAATLAATVRIAVARVGGEAGAALGGAIGSVFGPPGQVIGAYVGRFVGRYVGDRIGTALSETVNWVATKAKQAISAVGGTVSRVWETIKESRLNPLNWIA